MSRIRKCVCCGEPIGSDDESVPYKGRFAHRRCFNAAMMALSKGKQETLAKSDRKRRQTKAKPPAELKESVSEAEYQEKRKYYDYLRGLIGSDRMTAKVYAVSEDCIRRYKMSWEGMYRTLVYLNEVMEKDLAGDVVGLLPYYYGAAEAFYQDVDRIRETVDNGGGAGTYGRTTVRIQPHRSMERQQIDITSIGND